MVGIPAYQRIYEDLAGLIRSGELAPDMRLQPETLLATQYGVARMTVRQAIGRLVDESLVVRQPGVGTFVAQDSARRRSLNQLTSFTEDMEAASRRFDTEILLQRVVDPAPDVARILKLHAGASVVELRRLRREGGKPSSLQHSFLPYGLFPSLAREPLIEGSLYRTLEKKFDVRLRSADQRIAAVRVGKAEAELLGIATGSSVLRIERVTMNEQSTEIEFARSWALPGFELTVHLER